MKVIVTGATGFIGSHIVAACVASPDISSVIVLTRRSLDNATVKNSTKVTEIIHEDFSQYPSDLLERLKGAGACIWAIGGRVTQFPDLETAKRVGIEYTHAGAQAFLQHVTPSLEAGQKFRFVYCSGWGATEDPNKTLLIVPDTRRIKGVAEKGLFDIAKSSPDNFEVYCLRPAAVFPPTYKGVYSIAGALLPAVMVTDLAKAFVTVATKGYTKPIIENSEITKLTK
ncbi:hypothetical protein VTN77DRAFT_5166 [Rasamsonia byssochlamydoides]|uniref:uncharacterized protein n=1 Tax=Rasamsonia byssochlamydoides TaxID=89139 RepID=UPI0037442BA6